MRAWGPFGPFFYVQDLPAGAPGYVARAMDGGGDVVKFTLIQINYRALVTQLQDIAAGRSAGSTTRVDDFFQHPRTGAKFL